MSPQDKARDAYLKRTHGITSLEYAAMLSRQGGGCAICKAPPSPGKYLAVDHCHRSGQIRGLLCGGYGCNRMLGLVRDNANWCLHAATYLATSSVAANYSIERKEYAGKITGKARRKRIARRQKPPA